MVERLGDICFKSEDKEFEAALGYYQRAEKLTPESYEIHLKEGKCFEKLREFKRAIEEYETAVELNKRQNALPLFRLAWAYIRSGEKQKGIDMLKEALEIEPDNVEVLTRLGESLLREQAPAEGRRPPLDEAEEYLQRALRIDPALSDALLALGRVFEKKGATEDAMVQYERATKLASPNAYAFFYLGVIHEKKKEYKRSITLFK